MQGTKRKKISRESNFPSSFQRRRGARDGGRRRGEKWSVGEGGRGWGSLKLIDLGLMTLKNYDGYQLVAGN